MNPEYELHDTSDIYTPALLFYKDIIRRNIDRCLEMAGSPERLRPHCKTHKTREVTGMELAAGITKHKCATIAEAEMLAGCGVRDILLAYNLVGPNCRRFAELVARYPDWKFSTLVDHPAAARALSAAVARTGRTAGVLLDVDVGQHRTGIAPGEAAVSLYQLVDELPGLEPRGLHVYDGHNHQGDASERGAAVHQQMQPVLALRAELERLGRSVPTVVAGGTPTFPVYAKMEVPGLECAPGTCILHDDGYGSRFPDLQGFTPAAVLLTRVISKPTPTRVTLDLGYKAVASDPPAGHRLTLLNLPEGYEAVLQNEEHLVIETPAADRLQPGGVVYAVPTHVCPTCAMHQWAYVVEGGRVTDRWDVVGRDRVLTV